MLRQLVHFLLAQTSGGCLVSVFWWKQGAEGAGILVSVLCLSLMCHDPGWVIWGAGLLDNNAGKVTSRLDIEFCLQMSSRHSKCLCLIFSRCVLKSSDRFPHPPQGILFQTSPFQRCRWKPRSVTGHLLSVPPWHARSDYYSDLSFCFSSQVRLRIVQWVWK